MKNKIMKRILSTILSISLLLQIGLPAAYAEGGDQANTSENIESSTQEITIISFTELSENEKYITVPLGITEEELSLPEMVTATVEYSVYEEDGDVLENRVAGDVDLAVAWNSEIDFSSIAEAEFIFTAKLTDENYVLAEGVEIPQITVRVVDSRELLNDGPEFKDQMISGKRGLYGEGGASQETHTYDISEGDINIKKGTGENIQVTYGESLTSEEFSNTEIITIQGETTSSAITVEEGVSANIILSGVNIDVSTIVDKSAFKIVRDGSKVNLTLDGENTLKSGQRSAGLQMQGNSELTIGGLGELIATGGQSAAGIGGGYAGSLNGKVEIIGGTVTAIGGTSTREKKGAGIGGGLQGNGVGGELSGTVKITGGIVTATGGVSSAGIGGGSGGKLSGTVEITGGTVTATGGSDGAGIGGGVGYSLSGTVKITGGTVTATGGKESSGIGGGSGGSLSGMVEITSGTVTATGGDFGSGIGGGASGALSGTVKITGGAVTATGGKEGSGIGGAYRGALTGTVKITGGTVTATGGDFGSGIGGGSEGELTGMVEITGGKVTATGGDDGAGIGGGAIYSLSGRIEIEGELVVSEEGKKFAIAEGTVLTKVYDGETFEPAYGIPGSGTILYSYQHKNGENYEDVTGSSKNVGEYKVTTSISKEEGKINITAKFEIRPKEVTIRASIKSKIYDGNAKGEIDTFSIEGKIGEDNLEIDPTNILVAFSDATVGENKNVTVSGIRLTGNHAANYTAADTITTTGTIKEAPKSSAKDITAFTVPAQIGESIIDTESKTITLTVANATELSNLRATFIASEKATVKVNETIQESGTTENDFTNPVTYTVVAEDATVQDWLVTVTVANADQATPEGLEAIAPTTIVDNDGKIIGTTTDMEYKLKSAEEWTAITATKITGLSAGTYEVRLAAKTGFNAGQVVEVEVPVYVRSSNTEVTAVKVKGNPATKESANNYEIELPAGTILSELAAANIELILQDPRATQTLATTSDGGATWIVQVTAEDGTTKTYTIKVRVANSEQAPPTETLKGQAPTTIADNDGKITGTTVEMEYKLISEENWTQATAGEIIGLKAGTYQIRYKTKPGYNAGNAVEVTVDKYVKSEIATLRDLRVDGETVVGFAAETLAYYVELLAGTEIDPQVLATLTDEKASALVRPAISLPGSTTVEVTAEDGTTKTYTINFTVANADQTPPTETLQGQAPTTITDNDGKITGTTVEMEYKLISEDSWTQATAGETTGLKAGTYQIRYKTKPGYNAGAIATVEVAEYIKSAEVGVVSVKVKGNPATKESANNYEIELPAGTILSELAAANIELILQDPRATQTPATTSDGGATWVIEVTAEDGTTKTYTIKVSVANAEQNAPEGLIGIAPTSASNADGKIKNTTDKMEYRLKGASSFIGIDGTEVTGLTPGTYEVRLLAREGYNAGAVAEVIVGEYRKDSSSDNSSGGRPSNNIDTSSKDTTRVETKKESNTPTKVIASTSAKVTKGTAIVQVSKNTVKDAIEKAQAAAKKNATEEDGISVEIKVDGENIKTSNLSANIGKSTIEDLTKAGVKNLSINSDVALISLDFQTLKTIQKEIKTDINFSAKKVEKTTLSVEVQKMVGDRPVFDFSITGTNGEKVRNFGKGKISISIPYILGAGEKAENITIYYINEQGHVEEMSNSHYNEENGTISFETDHFSKFAVGYKENIIVFTDIENHWAKNDIEFVTARGLFSGTGDNKFSPEMSMTRGMFVTVLGRLAQADTNNYKESSFKDVKIDAYYMPSTEWAKENNIVNGISATEFAPEQPITREQMAVIMENYSKSTGFELTKVKAENIFTDSEQISNYAKVAVKQMQMAGIISGKDNNKFEPQGTATRAEVSAVLKRFIGVVAK